MKIREKIKKILYMELGSKINILDLSISLKEAGLLLKSKINTSDTMNLLAKTSPNEKLKNVFKQIYNNLLKGYDLHDSFKSTKKFDDLFLSLIKSGESSEKLSEVFLYLSLYYEKKYKLKQKIISIMTYPLILLFVSLVVLIFMMNNIVPMFVEIFNQSDVELPKVTLYLINFINFFRTKYLYLIFAILILFFIIKYLKKNTKVRMFFGKLLLQIPYIKVHYQNYITSVIAKNLTILLKGNINILESLKIIEHSTKNLFISEHIKKARDKISKGNSISKSLENDLVFNMAFINMLNIGESSESLVEILESATEYYDQKINYSADKMLQYLQPVVILLISLFVGFIVFAIAIPIFDLSNGININ